MQVFLSHAQKDDLLARKLRERLEQSAFDVWDPQDQLGPGDNWAKKVGKALDDSDLLVILLTPGAMKADGLRRDVEFAIGSRQYANRVYTVFVGPTLQAGKDIPWVLLKLPHSQVEADADFDSALSGIQQLADSVTAKSHA